jgi:plastocyanin
MRNLTKRHRSSVWRRCRALFIAAALAAVSTLPVCAADMEVNIDNFAFAPKELTVKAGTTIVFRNRDDSRRVPHQALFEHRHTEPSPAFHANIVETFHSGLGLFVLPTTSRATSRATSAPAHPLKGRPRKNGSSEPFCPRWPRAPSSGWRQRARSGMPARHPRQDANMEDDGRASPQQGGNEDAFFESWCAEQGLDVVGAATSLPQPPSDPDDSAEQDELRDTIKQLIAAQKRSVPNSPIDKLPHVTEEQRPAKSFDLVHEVTATERGREGRQRRAPAPLPRTQAGRSARHPRGQERHPAPSPPVEPEAQRELSEVERAMAWRPPR